MRFERSGIFIFSKTSIIIDVMNCDERFINGLVTSCEILRRCAGVHHGKRLKRHWMLHSCRGQDKAL